MNVSEILRKHSTTYSGLRRAKASHSGLPLYLRKHSTIHSGFYTCGVAARRLGNGQASLSATLALRSSKTIHHDTQWIKTI